MLPETPWFIEFIFSDKKWREIDFWKHHFSVFKIFICKFLIWHFSIQSNWGLEKLLSKGKYESLKSDCRIWAQMVKNRDQGMKPNLAGRLEKSKTFYFYFIFCPLFKQNEFINCRTLNWLFLQIKNQFCWFWIEIAK